MDILLPDGWPRPKGYSNGVAASGRIVFVSGQVGWNEKEDFESDELVSQFRQVLLNTLAVLKIGDARPAHIVRMTWYITDKKEYLSHLKEIGEIYRELIGNHFPAMALVEVNSLLEDRAKIEIETTAVIPEKE